MKKIIILWALLFSSLSLAKSTLTYSAPVDVLHFLDQLAKWHPQMTGTYREAFKAKFGQLTQDDLRFLDRYSNLRQKSLSQISNTETFLIASERQPWGTFDQAFIKARTLNDVFPLLKGSYTEQEIEFFKSIIKRFQKQLSHFMGESAQFRKNLKDHEKRLVKKKWANYRKRLTKLLGHQPKIVKGQKVFFVWWPKDKAPSLKLWGHHLLVGINPLHDIQEDQLHRLLGLGLAKAWLAALAPNDKLQLTKVFLEGCKTKTAQLNALRLNNGLRESFLWAFGPLLWQQVRHRKKDLIKDLIPTTAHPMTSLLAPLWAYKINNYLQQKKNIGPALMQIMAVDCHHMIRFLDSRR